MRGRIYVSGHTSTGNSIDIGPRQSCAYDRLLPARVVDNLHPLDVVENLHPLNGHVRTVYEAYVLPKKTCSKGFRTS
jgi:hypothetical protein